MRTHLCLGGPAHGQVRTLIDCCSGALIIIDDKHYSYQRETFVAPITGVTYDLLVRGDISQVTPAMIVGMLSKHGLL